MTGLLTRKVSFAGEAGAVFCEPIEHEECDFWRFTLDDGANDERYWR